MFEQRRVAHAGVQRRDQLLHDDDPAVRARAQAVLGANVSSDRKDLVARYASEVSRLSADAARGAEVFRAQCAACHRPERGERVGPNLATLQDRSPPTLLAAILDPNRDVKPPFVNYVVRTKDGQDLSGVIAAETESWTTTEIVVVGGASHFFVGRTDRVVEVTASYVDRVVG